MCGRFAGEDGYAPVLRRRDATINDTAPTSTSPPPRAIAHHGTDPPVAGSSERRVLVTVTAIVVPAAVTVKDAGEICGVPHAPPVGADGVASDTTQVLPTGTVVGTAVTPVATFQRRLRGIRRDGHRRTHLRLTSVGASVV